MSTTVTPLNLCPHCGNPVDRATDIDGTNVPEAGDVTVCLACTGVSEFLRDLTLNPIDVDSLDPETREVVDQYRSLIAEYGGNLPRNDTQQH